MRCGDLYQHINVGPLLCPGSSVFNVLIGNREWMKHHSIVLSDDVDMEMQNLETVGQTVVLCAIDGTLYAECLKLKQNC